MRHNHARLLLIALFLALASSALASTTWYVNGVTGSDSNTCTSPTTACKTIKHAISLASSGDSIMVAAATYTENLTINISLRIVGSGARTTIIDGGGVGRVVTISSTAAHVTLSGVTIRNGSGGGIVNNGILRIIGSTVSGNAARGSGSGIVNNGILRIIGSTVSGNLALATCGRNQPCRLSGGGIFNVAGATLTISNSTVSGNHASLSGCSVGYCALAGGGIYNVGTLTLNNSTVSGNTLFGGFSFGGGIYSTSIATISNGTVTRNSASGIYGRATLQDSIVANNYKNCSGSIVSNGYNLSSDNTCNFTNTGDLNNTDPMLGPLQYNGGPTQTMALPSGSPAVDAGNPSGCTDGLGHLLKTDQRGKPRPDTEDTGGCDMGAYERQSD